MNQDSIAACPAFLNGGGELAGLIAAYPWHGTSLGPLQAWPSHVRHTVALMLRCAVPMVALFGPQGVMVYNDAYALFAGGRHPALLGAPVRQGWPEVADFNDYVMRAVLAGRTLSYTDQELTLSRRGHAEQVWMNLDCSPVLDDAGCPAGVLAIVVETTAKVKAERRVAHERARLHRMFEQAPGFIFTLSGPEHRFEFANAAFRQLFGRADVVGRTVREAFPELAGQGLHEQLDAVYRTGQPFQADAAPVLVNVTPGGPAQQLYLNFVYQPLWDDAGGVTGIFCEGFDVSERVRAHADLQRTQDWLQEGLQAAQMVAFEWDFATRLVKYSHNSPQVLGYSDGRQEAGFASVHPDDRARLDQAVSAAIRGLGLYHEVVRRIRPDTGAVIWTDTRGRVYGDESGKPAYMRGIMIDVTERIRSEQALTEANRRKDEFLAMLAHELRNPLAPIATASALLDRSAGNVEVVRKASDVIARQVRHMSHLVDDLLDVSRVTRGLVQLQKAEVELEDVVHGALEQARPLMESRRHAVTLELPGQQVWVQGDRTRLVQVLVNLLANAAKYTPPGGHVRVALRTDATRAELSVADDGNGIAPELLPHVFDLFTQGERTPDRSQGGLGIGLALVKALVGLHGGEVRAHSEGRGAGSRFSVYLPLARAPEQRGQQPAAAPASAHSLHILVTDDNVDAAQTLAALLEMEGHVVQACYDGQEALAAAQVQAPQVCILDVGLPDMTGLELARRLQAMPALADALYIAVTGYGQMHDRLATAAAGFQHHLVKPVDPAALSALLAGHLKGRQG